MRFTPHDRLSAEIAQFCRAYLPDDVFASCIAHGGRNFTMAVKLKQLGTRAGIPDWVLIHDGITRFVELKTGKATLRTDQRKTRDALKLAGARVVVVHSLDEFQDTLQLWGIPCRLTPREDPIADDTEGLWIEE